MEQNTKAQRERLRDAYIKLGNDMQPNAFVTLATNDYGDVLEMTRLIGEYLAMMDRALLGRKWSQFPAAQRTDGIFMIEHTKTNIHAHGLVSFPNADKYDLEVLTLSKWNKLTEAGTIDFQSIYDTQTCAEYCTKEMRSVLFNPDQVVLARQFMAA